MFCSQVITCKIGIIAELVIQFCTKILIFKLIVLNDPRPFQNRYCAIARIEVILCSRFQTISSIPISAGSDNNVFFN